MYCKLFASLYQGTLRGKSHEILVFTNLLANADAYGYVDKHFKAIAEEVGLTQDEVRSAIAVLEAPDPESRSPEEAGARIVKMDDHRIWGWKIVNYGKYRAIKNEDDRREQNRLAQERFRQKNKQPSAIVSRVSLGKPPSAQAEAEGSSHTHTEHDAAIPTLQEVLSEADMRGLKRESAQSFFNHHQDNSLWVNQFNRLIDWRSKLRSWATKDRTQKHEGNKRNNPQRIDRSIGTANEGAASEYAGLGNILGD